MSLATSDPAAEPVGARTTQINALRRAFSRSDLSTLPIILGLAVIWLVFQIANPNFLTPLNLTNLMLQITALGTISVGVVIVLLVGEIDLSVSWVSGLCAAVMAVANVRHGVPGPLAVLIGLATGLLIGLFQGAWTVRARVPSFIVTLAGLLAWQGALQAVLGNTGTVNLRDPFILGLTGTFFVPIVGWGVGVLFIVVFVGTAFARRRRRLAAGLRAQPPPLIAAQSAIVAAVALSTIGMFNADRGLPLATVLLIGVVLAFHALIKHTAWGEHIMAIGGSAQTARRAGIDVGRVRVSVFVLCSMLAAWGGVLAASRLLAVNQSSGGGDLLFNAIAAAVIGGASLFGGRGTVWSALLGALVIGSISNGIDLLALPSSTKFMITGAVLLAAVTVDASARRRREAAGR